jgi:hypothetical protein
MIEELIRKNIGAFFKEDIPDGHIERFEQKLNREFPVLDNIRSFKILMLAASIIFFITTFTILLINMRYSLPGKQILTLATPEMYEAEQFYLNAISEKINILNKKKKISIELSGDLKEIDKTIKSISKEMTQNPGDQRLISAVINVYQSKLDLLDDVITHTQ